MRPARCPASVSVRSSASSGRSPPRLVPSAARRRGRETLVWRGGRPSQPRLCLRGPGAGASASRGSRHGALLSGPEASWTGRGGPRGFSEREPGLVPGPRSRQGGSFLEGMRINVVLQGLLKSARLWPGDATWFSSRPGVWGELEPPRPVRGGSHVLWGGGGALALASAHFWRIPLLVLVSTCIRKRKEAVWAGREVEL